MSHIATDEGLRGTYPESLNNGVTLRRVSLKADVGARAPSR